MIMSQILNLSEVDLGDLFIKDISVQQDTVDVTAFGQSSGSMIGGSKELEITASLNMNDYTIYADVDGTQHLVKKYGDGSAKTEKEKMRRMSVLGKLRQVLGESDLVFDDLNVRERKMYYLIKDLMYDD